MNVPFLKKRNEVTPVETNPFVSLQREVERVFSEFSRGLPTFGMEWSQVTAPRMDIVEKNGFIEMTAELPGLEPKDVEIELEDNILTIKGQKKVEREEKDETRYLSERSFGAFTRSIELPEGVKPEDVKASMANGILKVTMPKPAEPAKAQPKKVEITAAA